MPLLFLPGSPGGHFVSSARSTHYHSARYDGADFESGTNAEPSIYPSHALPAGAYRRVNNLFTKKSQLGLAIFATLGYDMLALGKSEC